PISRFRGADGLGSDGVEIPEGFVGFFETRQLHGAEDQGAVSQMNGFLLQFKAESFAGHGGVKIGGQVLCGFNGCWNPKMSCSLLFSHSWQVPCGKGTEKREANS